MASAQFFNELGLDQAILQALHDLGYERPSPIQSQSIPVLLEGRDLLAQAQTGTGKTAAFALPILNRLNLKKMEPQTLVLAPTRELAIQVAEAFQSYAKYISGFHVLPIYGGQDYSRQLRALKRGAHVVVGTPGRIMDHLRRGTLKMDAITTLVLDEADEMLRMGFIEDVEWILEQIKQSHQTALFSATIPTPILKVAKRFLQNPEKIHIEPTTRAVTSIDQYYMIVSKANKLEALTRYFEMEEVDAALVFTGTKTYSMEVAEKLAARGYAAAALNGDMSQSLREQVIAKLKAGALDIVVATEVAARGLDVDRISHVINIDIPQAVESYIHRIGRTGRAGRSGKALLLVTPKEQRMLQMIKQAIQHKIKLIEPPTAHQIQTQRANKLAADVKEIIATQNLDRYRELAETIARNNECNELDVAAAMIYLGYKLEPKLESIEETMAPKRRDDEGRHKKSRRNRANNKFRKHARNKSYNDNNDKPSKPKRRRR